MDLVHVTCRFVLCEKVHKCKKEQKAEKFKNKTTEKKGTTTLSNSRYISDLVN